jgi:hypothetical protein
MKFLQLNTFWKPAVIATAIAAILFLWLLGTFNGVIWSPPRPAPDMLEWLFTIALIILIGLNVGLMSYQRKHGSCPIGAKRASRIGGTIGALALVCPACIAVPLSIAGLGTALSLFATFLPMLQVVSIVLMVMSAVILAKKS